jgi:excisionase family DNA binding protein
MRIEQPTTATRQEANPMERPQPLLLTVPEAARVLGIGRSTLYELIAAGAIDTVHIGRACRIPISALKHFVESLRQSA